MDWKNIHRKIGFKLIFLVGFTVLAIISVYSFFNIRSTSDVLLEEVERHANQLSETVKKSTRYDMLANRREHIHNIINTIGEEPCIRDVRVLNKEGEIMYSADSSDIGRVIDKNAEACFGCHAENQPIESLSIKERTRIYKLHPDSSRVMGIINPIYNEPSCSVAECHAHEPEQKVLGVLDIIICLKNVDQNVHQAEVKMIAFAIISILSISFIIGFFVRRWVDKPVSQLVGATKSVASGNLNYTIENTRNDELGALADSFNNMTQKLSEARMQLFQSDKMASLGRLAAGVAHEINNPLTGVLTYSSFLLKRTEGEQDIQEDLKVIVRETKRSREIVKSLLDFARQTVPKKTSANINEIVDKAASVVENQLQINKIALVKKFDPELPFITVDANQIQQVFINLIVNAADAIGKDGTITLTTKTISLSPFGIAQIKKANCPKRHSLIDNEVRIDNMPSIKLKAKVNGNEGFINLDPIYGRNRNQFGIQIHADKMIDIHCPTCDISLINKNKLCPKCNSPIYSFEVPGQGMFEGCIKKGCDWQKWDKVDKEGMQQFVEIIVSDTGCGISQESLSKIFEPFYSTKGQKGTGLGLAVSWGIIDNHDGLIKVESELNKGTDFIIRLPINQKGI